MTKTTLSVSIDLQYAPNGPLITLKKDDRTLDCSLYDDWVLAGSLLRALTRALIPDGNFTLWHRWSLQSERDPISRVAAQGVWDGLPIHETPMLLVNAMHWPSPIHIGNGHPRVSSTPTLVANNRNAVAQILDKYTEVLDPVDPIPMGDTLVITNVAELQRELVALVDAAKG